MELALALQILLKRQDITFLQQLNALHHSQRVALLQELLKGLLLNRIERDCVQVYSISINSLVREPRVWLLDDGGWVEVSELELVGALVFVGVLREKDLVELGLIYFRWFLTLCSCSVVLIHVLFYFLL